jgi:SAM-dependent MidA family methyltransferase
VQKRCPEFFDALRYRIIEPFPILKEQQCRMLEAFGDKIEWRASSEPFTGVHFSNELLDAMPVRLISDGTEKLVGLEGDKFVFVERPIDKAILNQPALDWIDGIAANLQRGYVITIDYGCTNEDCRRNVQVRAQHRNLHSPFDSIGDADITMSVDWESILKRAQANCLCVAGFTDQHHFLTGIISQFESGDRGQSLLADSRKAKRELQTLLHPEMLGRTFQVLALAKNVGREGDPLAGFKFARDRALAR